MSRFLKVRASSGPKHEFYAAVDDVEANPDVYEVIDKKPVENPGPVKYVTEVGDPTAVAEEPAAGGPQTTSTKGQSK